MIIDELIFKNFRNFELKHLNTEKINIVFGKNASGKTNLLEGIYTILNGHSFKKSNVIIQKHHSKETYLSGIVDENRVEIEIKNNIKSIKLNSKRSNIVKLKELFPSVIYSIDSFLSFKSKDYLFSLIDRNSFIEDKKIIDYLMEYKKLIKIKRKILNTPKVPDDKILKITNEKIYEIMDKIAIKREESIRYINNIINNTFNLFSTKKVEIKYKRQEINKNITQVEINTKKVLTSINKDRIEIILDNKNVFEYSSVGEKKVVLFSFIISIIRHYNIYKTPVVLIDDLEGDLDEKFKNVAFDILVNLPNQLFLTTLGEYLYNDANIIRL